jgi:hypothetical protein
MMVVPSFPGRENKKDYSRNSSLSSSINIFMNCPVSLYILLGQVSHINDGEMKETTPAAIAPCWKIVCEPLPKLDKF